MFGARTFWSRLNAADEKPRHGLHADLLSLPAAWVTRRAILEEVGDEVERWGLEGSAGRRPLFRALAVQNGLTRCHRGHLGRSVCGSMDLLRELDTCIYPDLCIYNEAVICIYNLCIYNEAVICIYFVIVY